MEILSGLSRLPIGEVVAATGLSEHYCSLARHPLAESHPLGLGGASTDWCWPIADVPHARQVPASRWPG